MNTPVLFLDFDGVLHALGEPAISENFRLLANPCLFRWRPILEEALAAYPSVRVIVSSDWRRIFDDDALVALLGPDLGARFIGVVPHAGPSRHAEILKEAARLHLEHWLALDDHPTVVAAAQAGDARFIVCLPDSGLSHPQVQQQLAVALARLMKRVG